jgi:FkbM family methyltransferase
MHPKDIFFEGIKGVCHVGAWDGAEIETYYNNGVKLIVWVEPISTVFSRLIKNTCSYNINQFWLPLCLSNENDIVVNFNITNNGESSSFMELGKLHKETYPHIISEYSVKLLTTRFDSYYKRQSEFDWSNINLLNIDCQGADLKVLQGFGDLLKSPTLTYIKSEVNYGEMYVDNPSEDDIDNFLQKFNYSKHSWYRVDNGSWGDITWKKN